LIVVDTSVWVELFRGTDSPATEALTDLIEGAAQLAITDVIFTELLQGAKNDRKAEHLESHLRTFPLLRSVDLDDSAHAAKLFRDARRRGLTVRNTTDCLIAAPCIRAGAELFHLDADFDRLASVSELKIWHP
jgi:predicted nucleic acid-binding protein